MLSLFQKARLPLADMGLEIFFRNELIEPKITSIRQLGKALFLSPEREDDGLSRPFASFTSPKHYLEVGGRGLGKNSSRKLDRFKKSKWLFKLGCWMINIPM